MSRPLTREELVEFQEIFNLMDPERKGYVMVEDVHQLLQTLHLRPTAEELAELFAADPTPMPTPTSSLQQQQSSAALSAFSVAAMGASQNSAGGTPGGSVLGGAAALHGGNSAVHTGPPGSQRITFDKFVSVLTKRLVSDFSPSEVCQAFEVFESDEMPQGVISAEVLAHALMTYGSEKLTREEVEKLLSAVDPQNTGYIYYREFVDLVMGEL